MKHIAIIGANGYIARNLAYLLQKNYEDCDIKLYGIEAVSADGNHNYIQVNMLDKKSIKQIDLSCDFVFMFVGKTGSIISFDEYDVFIDVNEKSLLNLLNECRNQKSKAKIIFPSTRLVYKGKSELQKEDSEKEFNTIYSINKFACEQYLRQYYNVFGINYCIFRICLPYGTLVTGASSYGTIDFMLKKAENNENITLYGDGAGRRSLIHIEDLCKILIEGSFSPKCINDVYNIGGENYSLREMAELIARKHRVSVEYIAWPKDAARIESGDTVFDSSKLDEILKIPLNINFASWINC